MGFCKHIFIYALIVFQPVLGQSKPEISDLTMDVKQNGIFIKLKTTVPVDLQNITGWATESGWFYITVLGAISDSVSITHSQYKFPITNIQTANSTESTQIALQFQREIESFEFYQSDVPPEILLSLRFPVDEIFVQAEKGNISKQISKFGFQKTNKSRQYKRIRTGLYLVGTSLTVAGTMDMDNKNEMSWELPAGLSILAGTYFFDTVLRPKLNKN